jgi:diguanylate cyclase (GGDEF)-like protein
MAKTAWLRRQRDDGEEDVMPRIGEEPRGSAPDGGTERERQLHGLALLSLFLHSTATIEEMMGALLEQAPTVTGCVFVYPLLLERKRQVLRASALEGSNDPRLEAAMDAFQEDLTALEFNLVQNPELYRILESGEVSLVDGFQVIMGGVLAEEQWRDAAEKLGVRRLALVPMVVENESLGLVAFAYDHDEVDVEALELLVGHLTLALRDLLVRDDAVRFSDIDPVTWVHNRRYLTQALQSEMVRAGRYGRGLSVVMLDIDDFAAFNASYGQSMGDRLLRTFATTLAEAVSPPELVARIHDDDFAVLLPEASRATAVMTATRLLASLSQVSIFSGNGDDETEPVTFSVAIACFPDDGATPHELLERVMHDLEIAKTDRKEELRRSRETRARAAGKA